MKKIQKITFIFMLILMTVACFVFTASAEDLVYGDYSYVLLEDETVKITGYNGSEADVVIPAEIDGKAVTVIGEYAFDSENELVSLVIPGTVKEIEKQGVHGCESLTVVTIEEGVLENVYNTAFEGCRSLKTVNLPSNITSIGSFLGCTALEEINVSEENESIKSVDGIVYSADMKAFVKFPQGKNIAKYTIPNTVETIRKFAFYEVGSPVNVYIPLSVSVIEEMAFGYSKVKLFYEGSTIPSGWSIEGFDVKTNAFTLGRPEKITSVQNATAIALSWTPVEGAQFYRIFVRNANGWRVLNDTTETTQLYKNLRVGTKFTFAVRAGKTVDGKEVLAPTFSTYETSTATVAPAKIASAQNASVIKLAWTACPGATGYRIFFKTESGWQTCLRATTKTSHAFTRLQPGSKFTFAVRPYVQTNDTIVWCPYTTYIASTTLSPVNLRATATGDSQVTLEWDAVNGADAYRIFCSLDGGKTFKVYKNQTARSIVINNLYVGRPYTFAVRAATITSSGLVWDSSYTPRTITLKSYTQTVLQSMKNGNFQMGIGANDVIAVKNGVVVIKGTDSEGEVFRVVSNKNASDSWYMIYDDYKAYTVLTSQQLGLEQGYADSFLNGLKTINPNTGFVVSRITVGGKPYIVESRSDKYGTEYYTYDSNGKLVLIKEVLKSGVTYTTNVGHFTTNVPNSMITLPSDYERFYVS